MRPRNGVQGGCTPQGEARLRARQVQAHRGRGGRPRPLPWVEAGHGTRRLELLCFVFLQHPPKGKPVTTAQGRSAEGAGAARPGLARHRLEHPGRVPTQGPLREQELRAPPPLGQGLEAPLHSTAFANMARAERGTSRKSASPSPRAEGGLISRTPRYKTSTLQPEPPRGVQIPRVRVEETKSTEQGDCSDTLPIKDATTGRTGEWNGSVRMRAGPRPECSEATRPRPSSEAKEVAPTRLRNDGMLGEGRPGPFIVRERLPQASARARLTLTRARAPHFPPGLSHMRGEEGGGCSACGFLLSFPEKFLERWNLRESWGMGNKRFPEENEILKSTLPPPFLQPSSRGQSRAQAHRDTHGRGKSAGRRRSSPGPRGRRARQGRSQGGMSPARGAALAVAHA